MKSRALSITRCTIPYVKELRPIAGSITACILMQQLDYWFSRYPDKFYKFLEPCLTRDRYKEGQSWAEELAISAKEFRCAFDKIGTRYPSETEFVKSEGKFKGKFYCCYFDKATGLTWYFRDHDLTDAAIDSVFSASPPNSPSVTTLLPDGHYPTAYRSLPSYPMGTTQQPIGNPPSAETLTGYTLQAPSYTTPEITSKITSHSGLDPFAPSVASPSIPPNVVTTPTQRGVCESDLIKEKEKERIDLGSEAEILEEVPREEIEQPSNDDKLNLGIETNQSRSKTNTETRQSGSEKKEIPPTPLSSRPAPEKPIDPEYSSAQRYENSMRNLALKEIPLWRTAKGKSAIGLNKEIMAALNLNLNKSFSRPWDAADTIGWVLAREKEDHPQHCVLIAKVEIIVQEMDERRNHDRLIQENGIVVQQPNDPTASQGIKPQPGRWAEILNLSISASAAQKEKERQAKLSKDPESASA